MKTFKKKLVMPLAMVVLAVGFIACGKKKNDDSSSVSAGRDDARTQSTSLSVPSGAAGTLGTQATVTASDANAAAFQESAKTLASASVDPVSIGTISNRNGVVIRGAVGVDKSNGQIVTSNSVIELDITDSNVGKTDTDGNTIPAIKIVLQGVSGGVLAGNQAKLVFGDNLGTVTISGHYDQNYFYGVVDFENSSKTYNGHSGGTLGSFQVPVCGFFRCN